MLQVESLSSVIQDRQSQKLVVTHVGCGGNTAEGEYEYKFSKDFLYIDNHFTHVKIELVDESERGLEIIDILFLDPNNQIIATEIAPDKKSVSYVDINTIKGLLKYTVVVKDSKETIIACDPQDGNNGMPGHTP